MDVRCERCKTEYEFDDARITEAGVTVKCTNCSHVFKVKKAAAQGDSGQAATEPTAPTHPTREWKVRQANGNVFTFKELTTLQKWIVERKVARDDEISITGESWKRLGNIAELASFFQVVEEAQKAAQLQGMLMASDTLSRTPAEPIAAVRPPVSAAPAPVAVPSVNLQVNYTPPPQAPAPAPAASLAPAPVPIARRVTPQPRPAVKVPMDDAAIEAAAFRRKSSGGAGAWIAWVLVVSALGASGYLGYFHYWLPQQAAVRAEAERARAEEQKRFEEHRAQVEAKARAEAEAKAAEEARLKKEAEEKAAALAAAPVDAGTPAPKPAEKDFDFYMAQGDRLREREHAQAALEAYGKAADLQPTRAEPHAGRGLALLDLGRPLEAEATFQQALLLNARYGVAVMGLAETYRTMGRHEESLKYYQRYLDVLPNGPEAAVARSAIERMKK